MFNTPFDAIDKDRIESLISNEARENMTLEYKEALPGGGREERREFLADVSAFANAVGGNIVFGVREKREGNKTTGLPEKAVGLAGINIDATIRQLESVITDGIEPRIGGLRIKSIDGFEQGPVIVLRIPKSYLSPHMVKLGDSRFYSRTNAGKQPLDVTQIRSAFALSESLPEKVRRFRDERIARIVAGETPILLPDRPKIVLHLLPVASLDPTTRVDLGILKLQSQLQQPINPGNGWSPRFNLDGFLVHSEAGTPNIPVTYLQAFRSGALEAVESRLLYYDNDNNPSSSKEPQNFISSIHCERTLIVALDQFLKVEKSLGMEPPVFVMLSFVGVREYRILSEWTQYEAPYQFDRDVLLLPESMVEDFDEPADQLLQPAFDAVWQAAGYERCRHYKNRQWFDDKDRPAPISPRHGPAR
jgi:Putative DNA-binding domain